MHSYNEIADLVLAPTFAVLCTVHVQCALARWITFLEYLLTVRVHGE